MCERFKHLILITLTTMKVFACNTVKIYKNKTQNIFKRGGGGGRTPGAPVLDPPLNIEYNPTPLHNKNN